jgi:hypothetical protein
MLKNGNRVVGIFVQIKKSYIYELPLNLINFSNRNIETDTFFMIAKSFFSMIISLEPSTREEQPHLNPLRDQVLSALLAII